jgi:diguanylate cyclase (GGDEF)-like protein
MADTTKRIDRAEIARRVERAEKLLQKGKTTDALQEYMQVLADDPQNDNVRQMAAELCLSLQRTGEAVKLLGDLFERQVESGDNTRASLTYKKLSRYVNPSVAQKIHFGRILEASNRKLAIETYENVLEDLTKQGKRAECLEVLKRLVALHPSERNFLRVGELSSELQDNKGAADAFLKLAQLSESSGGAAPWYERAYNADSSDVEIALGYGKSLMIQDQVGAAIFVLEPHAKAQTASQDLRETFAKALLAANRLTEAEPLVWQLYQLNPSRMEEIVALIGHFLDSNQDSDAVALARKLEQHQRGKGDRRALIAAMQELAGKHRACPEMLEFMSEMFNASNRETDYCQTLLKLFDLHCSLGNFAKAAECLDRAADVDPYESGHQKRLETLKGKIDDNRYKVIASRFTSAGKSESETSKSDGPTLGAAALQDLMLQAEILVQYGMRSKAIERLQRIQELFPHEEDRNPDLHQLYMSAGMTPRYTDSAPVSHAHMPSSAAKVSTPISVSVAAPMATETADVSNFTRVAEITRKLYRQSNADAVMTTSAHELGAQWKATRCVVAMRKPGLALTAVREFCAEGFAKGEPDTVAKVISAVQDLAISQGTVTISDALAAAELQPVREALATLGIASLLALPLSDGADQVGVLMLAQNTPRGWHSSDIVLLKSISDQIVIALNNAGLRRLVKSLSVTDEQSGLMKRASYLDLLMAETRRASQQNTPLTVALMQFGKRSALIKENGEKVAEAAMQQIGQIIAANIRQNDLAFSYEMTTVAIVLGETAEKEALMAVEKLRKLTTHVQISEKPLSISAGVAEAVMRQQYDAVDIVTEVINRVELALEMAIAQGAGGVVNLAAEAASAAVA